MKLAAVLIAVLPFALQAQQAPAALTVQGIVYDSLAKAPIRDAIVQFGHEDNSPGIVQATTDRDGKFSVKLTQGWWIGGFMHPRVDSLMIALPVKRFEVTTGIQKSLTLAIPSSRTLVTAFCGKPAEDSMGVVMGYVRRAPGQSRLDSGGVYVQWSEMQLGANGRGLERNMPTYRGRVNADGSYMVCDIPANTDVAVWAQRGTAATGLVNINVPGYGIARFDLVLDTLATRAVPVHLDSGVVSDTAGLLPGEKLRPAPRTGPARLSATVVNEKGVPLATARARVAGLSGAKSGPNGVFVLDSLPLGTQTLQVRALGYAPVERLLNVTGETAGDTIRMTSLRSVMDTIHVTGKRVYNTDQHGFELRRLGGMGRYVTRADIDRKRPYELTNLFYAQPGITVQFNQGHTYIFMRGMIARYCTPAVFIDGFQQTVDFVGDINWMVQPEDIEGIEIYASAPMTPPQFLGIGAVPCGSIVIWTRDRPRPVDPPKEKKP